VKVEGKTTGRSDPGDNPWRPATAQNKYRQVVCKSNPDLVVNPLTISLKDGKKSIAAVDKGANVLCWAVRTRPNIR
jgi:hypothetical protein